MRDLPRALIGSLLLAAPLACAAGNADEEALAQVYGDQDTVSIASGSRQPLRRAPAVASVITAQEIAAIGARDLDEVLETVPGVHLSAVSPRNFSLYQFRGITTSPHNPQVLLLQNGVPMTTLFRGDRGETWAGLPLENVARIEVIRGPGSALYGADAFAGVINIITKGGDDIAGTELGVRAGSFDSRDGWLMHGGRMGKAEVAAYARVGTTEGGRQHIAVDAQTLRDAQAGTHASLAPGPLATGYDSVDAGFDLAFDKWRLRGGYKLRDHLGSGMGVSSALDPVGHNRGERINADLSWTEPQFAPNWGVGFTGSFLHYVEDEHLQLLPPGTQFPTGSFPDGMIGGPSRKERQFRFSGFATYSGLTGHAVRLGAGHDDLDLYATSTYKNYLLNPAGVPVPSELMDYSGIQPHITPQRRRVDYLYAQDEWLLARDWTLTTGVRHDRYSDFGGTTNPRVALVWDARLDLTAKLLYGRAFRAPAFTEQYGINPVANGNPELKPETIDSLEAALSWQARQDLQLNLSLFRYNLADMIRPVPNAAPAVGSVFQNSGRQRGSGMELEWAWNALPTLRLSGNYAYQQGIDEATGRDAGYAPHHHLYARGEWTPTRGWLTSLQLNRVADRRRPANDPRPQVPDYTTVDLTVRTTGKRQQWHTAFSARNLFNAEALEPSTVRTLPVDVPVAPRTVWVQFTYGL